MRVEDSPLMPEFKHVLRWPVQWGDQDAYQHVNNTIYFRYFEETRFQWMIEKGIPVVGDSYPVVVTIGCTFSARFSTPIPCVLTYLSPNPGAPALWRLTRFTPAPITKIRAAKVIQKLYGWIKRLANQ